MTYKDIYDKFLIEYDKATASASYPSFTKLEICTFLDKAYLALIAQKFTGNNQRGIGFLKDSKAILDLAGLIDKQKFLLDIHSVSNDAYNVVSTFGNTSYNNCDRLYIIGGSLTYFDDEDENYMYPDRITDDNTVGDVLSLTIHEYTIKRTENNPHITKICKLVSYETATKSFVTDTNYPRVKTPLIIVNDEHREPTSDFYDGPRIVLDPFELERNFYSQQAQYLYLGGIWLILEIIKKPTNFCDNESNLSSALFLLDDHIAEELINLAVSMALENIESPRTQTKIQINLLEP